MRFPKRQKGMGWVWRTRLRERVSSYRLVGFRPSSSAASESERSNFGWFDTRPPRCPREILRLQGWVPCPRYLGDAALKASRRLFGAYGTLRARSAGSIESETANQPDSCQVEGLNCGPRLTGSVLLFILQPECQALPVTAVYVRQFGRTYTGNQSLITEKFCTIFL
jgi:hypothetical protein